MKPFSDNCRYDYPDLSPESIVIDAGGFEGNFANLLTLQHPCRVIILEPTKDFYNNIVKRFGNDGRFRILNVGLGGTSRKETFGVKGDQTGLHCGGNSYEHVEIIGIADLLNDPELSDRDSIDLLKLNIEGMEFEVLETILAKNLATRFKNIQVQFHPIVPRFQERYDTIADGLGKTHALTYCTPWCWENWRIKT